MLPTILILDDEREVLKALERLLIGKFNVSIFTEPSEALAFFAESPTHIVLSDLKMPTMNLSLIHI